MKSVMTYAARLVSVIAVSLAFTFTPDAQAQTAASSYSAYKQTDTKTIPNAPALGPANSVITDPTFGSRILRVTDENTNAGESLISIDGGIFRAWNADSSAIKLTGPHGDGYWLEFHPNTFKVGDGSSHPAIHQLSFGERWEWSTLDPNIIYFLNGNQIASFNKSTSVTRNLGGPPNGDPVAYFPVVVGQDNWVCAPAGSGPQDSYTEIFCVNPINTGTTKFIDVLNKTINGTPQGDPNWPTSASGQTLGIHGVSGGTGASWLEVTFHGQSWGANGGAVFDLGTNTWSLVTNADPYWSGHVAMGNGKYTNGSGSVSGQDSRGYVVRNPDNLMNSSNYLFIEQPPAPPGSPNNWCDSEHASWFNSIKNANAPLLISRFNVGPCQWAWSGEIIAAAVDGSNTVWRFAHNHSTGSCYYGQGFAQISNDGQWALFSSYWDGQLGADTSFGCTTRIDTFIVQLVPPPLAITTTSLPGGTPNVPYSATLSATGGFPSYTWSITAGSLPPGLTLNANSGTISGTPSGNGGTSSFTIKVVDVASNSATATFSIQVASSSLAITTTSLPDGIQNAPYTATLSATGGIPPYTWSITAGSLPPGLTLDATSGTISGTPRGNGGTSNFTVRVVDAASNSATAALSINIVKKPGK